MEIIENKSFDQERALYGSDGITVKNCSFRGPLDGESALKESRNIKVEKCLFDLRYPLWHDKKLEVVDSEMTEKCRAALWYSEDIKIKNTNMHGIKALRECRDVEIENADIVSPEFGWSVDGIRMYDSKVDSEYFMMRSENIELEDIDFKGKYSFQYINNATFKDCNFDTKDAFWHAKNTTVINCTINGEYLAWYSDGLTLIDCTIIGTQPFCYCKNLKLVNCKMIDADLAFEKSDVDAEISSSVISIKNPHSGTIRVQDVDQIIMDDPEAKATVIKL